MRRVAKIWRNCRTVRQSVDNTPRRYYGKYHRCAPLRYPISERLEELARSRSGRSAAQVDFAELLSVGGEPASRSKLRRMPPNLPHPWVPVGGKKPKGPAHPHANKPPGWMPKKEYLSNLAAERAPQQASPNGKSANLRTEVVRGQLIDASTPTIFPAQLNANRRSVIADVNSWLPLLSPICGQIRKFIY